jgi:hypothetical protein
MTETEALRILNLEAGCTAEQVRQAYVDLVKVWHPDRFQSDGRLTARAERELQDINTAYGILQSAMAAGAKPSSPSYSVRASTQQQSPRPSASFTRSSSAAEVAPPQLPIVKTVATGVGLGLVITVVATTVVLMMRGPEIGSAGAQTTTAAPLQSTSTSASRTRETSVAGRNTPRIPRPESGTELLAPPRSGGGALVVYNESRRDAVVALSTPTGHERAVYVRTGEQITLANIATGTYRVQMMLGQDWSSDRFTREAAYQELEQPVQFVENSDGNTTEYTKLTVSLQPLVAGMRGVRPARPFHITPQ